MAEYCAQHASDGMVNVKIRMCRTEGCRKEPFFGVAGTKTAEYCTQHKRDGMVSVNKRKCTTEDCGKISSFGVAGTKTVEYCAQHAPDGMVNVKKRKYKTEGFGMISALGAAGSNTAGHCLQHSRLRYGVEECRGREIGPNQSGKKNIGDASPSGFKHKTVQSPPAQANPPSGYSRGSRKRVGDLHIIMPTALKRAAALESTAGAVTMPEIEGRKSPVKRDSSVKTEVTGLLLVRYTTRVYKSIRLNILRLFIHLAVGFVARL